MKSKWIPILTLCIIFCLTVGCNPKQERQEVETTAPETAASETTAPIQTNPVTEQELLDLFNGYAYADPANRVAVDCAVVTDYAYDLIGVVMYTTDDEAGCSFDFLGKDGSCVGRIGIGSTPTENANLEYLGTGVFTSQMLHTDGGSYLCRIIYSFDEENGTNYKVEEA